MNVYTKTGDQGMTSLLSGQRVPKDHIRVEAYGTVDEAMAAIGLAKSLLTDEKIIKILQEIQKELIDLSADLAVESSEGDNVSRITPEHVQKLEHYIDTLVKETIPQKHFAIPGQCPSGAALDLARTTVRRAERAAIKLDADRETSRNDLIYLNRLSDLLYVMARWMEQQDLVKTVKNQVLSVLQRSKGVERMSVLETAKRIIHEAEVKARELGVPMVIAVTDEGGNLVALHRMDGSLLVSISLAVDKAYTAVALKMPTAELASLSLPGQPLYGVNTTDKGRLVVFGGGIPIRDGDHILGGIGVSGGTVDEDILVAEAALAQQNKRGS